MRHLALLPVLLLALLPGTASAAVASADIHEHSEFTDGPVTFTAAAGERNRLTVSDKRGDTLFHDAGARVFARGDCKQVDAHTARCPFSEDLPDIKLGNGDDRIVS